MRYLNKIIFLNSAHIPYAEVKIDGNVHFIGTQGVGKSTLLRAILFFYNADKQRLGIPKEKKGFDAFYLPYSNSYIVYEVMRENGAYSVVVMKSMGRAAFRFVDAPYSKEWFINSSNEVSADWSEIRSRIALSHISSTPLITNYETYRDIIFGNNRKAEMLPFRKYAIVESPKYQNIPRTIQNVFLNSKLDADFIKDTIIRSMNDEEISIDLSYYRSQIEVFEQEHNDVMLWLKPNRNGEIAVRKQADNAIKYYRNLLYTKKEITDLRAELNFAESEAKRLRPALDEQIMQAAEKVTHIRQLIGEENARYEKERDKLNEIEGSFNEKLKYIDRQRQYYNARNIAEVMRRVANENSVAQELERQQRMYEELTAAHNDIIKKYQMLEAQLDNDLKAFEIERNQARLKLTEAANKRINDIRNKRTEQENIVRERFDEKREKMREDLLELEKEQNALINKKQSINAVPHFKTEIDECESVIRNLEHEQNDVSNQIEHLKLQTEKLRQECKEEMAKTSQPFDNQATQLRRLREDLQKEISHLNSLVEKHKGSLCEWLDNNVPAWHDTIGKVADTEYILFNQELNPRLLPDGATSMFGIGLDLSCVNREVPSLAKIKEEIGSKTAQCEEYTRQLLKLSEEKTAATERTKNNYNKHISATIEQQQLLEAQLGQIPSKIKNAKADLVTLQKREEEWKQTELTKIENELNSKSHGIIKIKSDLQLLSEEKEKCLKQVADEYLQEEAAEKKQLNDSIIAINNEIAQQTANVEKRKAELQQAQHRELSGEGADTSIISKYEQRIKELKKEQKYIDDNRTLVIEYQKDKREYFDNELQLRNDKKNNEAKIEELKARYNANRNSLNSQLNEAQNEQNRLANQQKRLLDDLDKLKSFKSDEILCPPESATSDIRPTNKSCSEIIEMLKSKIVSLNKSTEIFKQAVNLFKGNFSAKNTFSFPTALSSEDDYYNFAANLCEFVENDKISEYKNRISERYTNIIQRISKETGDLTQNESEIHKTINAINNDFVRRNFAGVIKRIELRPLASNDKLMQLLLEIQRFNNDNQFNMGALDLFSQDNRAEINEKAVRYLTSFSQLLHDDPSRKNLVLADTFKLEFRIMENDNDTGWVEKIANVGSDGTDILVKAMVNIMLINVFKEKASRKFGDFKIHCMMDEIGKLHPNNIKGIIDFANSRNILLINSSPTTYNVEDYRYTYLLNKDAKSNTHIVLLLDNKQKIYRDEK